MKTGKLCFGYSKSTKITSNQLVIRQNPVLKRGGKWLPLRVGKLPQLLIRMVRLTFSPKSPASPPCK